MEYFSSEPFKLALSGGHGLRTGSRSLDRPPLDPKNPLLSVSPFPENSPTQ